MFKIRTIKFNHPLRFFEKLSALYPAQMQYLQAYQQAQTNSTIKEKIGIILAKPHLKDSIFEEFDYSIDSSQYKRKKKVIPSTIETPNEKKETGFKKFFKGKLFIVRVAYWLGAGLLTWCSIWMR